MAARDLRELNRSLFKAAREGDVEFARKCISDGANVNYNEEYGKTPLYIASSSGHTDVVRLLLENKADPNVSDENGRTPLSVADNTDIVKLLKAHGATVEAVDNYRLHIPPLQQDVNGISERESSARIDACHDDVKDLPAPQIPLTVSTVDDTVIISNTVPQTDHGLEATDATGNTHVNPLVGKRDLAMKIADEHTKSTPTTSTNSSQLVTQPKPDVDESPPISPTNPSLNEAPPIPSLQQDVNGIAALAEREFSARINACVLPAPQTQIPLTVSNVDDTVPISNTVPQTDHGLEATDATGNIHINPVTVQTQPGRRAFILNHLYVEVARPSVVFLQQRD